MPTTVPLSDLATVNPAVTHRPDSDDIVSFVPMASLDAATASTSRGEDRRFEEVRKGYTIFSDGDILVAKITPCFENGKIGHATLGRPVGVGSTEFHVIRPLPDRLDAHYLLHFLRQRRILVDGERRMTGTGGQRRVPAGFLEALRISALHIEEQRRIAAILDQDADIRAKRHAALALLDDLAQAIFHEMFGDPLANPRRWPRRPLGDLLIGIDSGRSPNCLSRPAQGDEWGVLKLSAVTHGTFAPEQNKALPPGIQLLRQRDFEVHPGDLLMTRKNTASLVGAAVLVGETPPKRLLPDLVFRLQILNDDVVSKQYLHRLLMAPTKRKQIQALATGSAGSMPNISKAKLRAVLVELPPRSLQATFERRLSQLDTLRTTVRRSLADGDALSASLRQRAFPSR